MLYIVQTALELGFQYALVAMALFLSYRVLAIAAPTLKQWMAFQRKKRAALAGRKEEQ